MHHHVRDIAMDKHFSRLQTGDLVRRNPAVGTTDPHVARLLLREQPGEETRAIALHARRPGPVVVEEELGVGGH